MTTLYIREGAEYRPAGTELVLAHAAEVLARRLKGRGRVVNDPTEAGEFLRMHLGARDYEVFGVIHLDARNRLIEVEELFRGTIDGASVHPREVVKSVLARGAATVIPFHNHPSGSPDASMADETVTRRMKQVLALIDVRVLDHLIVGETVSSFANQGMI